MRALSFTSLLSFILLVAPCKLNAQSRAIDSLQTLLEQPLDTSQFSSYYEICWLYLEDADYDSAEIWSQLFFEAGEELESDRFKGEASYVHGISLARRGGHETESVVMQTTALKYFEADANLTGQGFANLMIGYVYYNQQNYSSARTFWNKSQELFTKAGNDVGLANVYVNLGIVENLEGNHEEALILYDKALTIFTVNHKRGGIATCLSAMSEILMDEYILSTDSIRMKALADSAYAYHIQAIELRHDSKDRQGLVSEWNSIARYFLTIGDAENALLYNDSSFALAVLIESQGDVRDAYAVYSDIYRLKQDYKKALEYYTLTSEMDDSLRGAEAGNNIANALAEYEAEKLQKEVQYKEDRAMMITISVACGLLITIVLSILAFRAYRKSRKFSALLADQNAIISQKNADITDSIQYSRRIQEALLPDARQVKNVLGDAFVFFAPKDIISGDFYWIQEQEDKVFFMAADCTGHGVPGALMSMMSTTLLNESVVVKKISEAGAILDDVRTGIIRSLKQQEENGDEGKTKDGMDGALCVFDRKTRTLTYAGAYNPMWIVRNNEIIEVKADKFPVGISGAEIVPFKTQHVAVQSDDMIYIFTDGYADQFGGSGGKKLKYSGLRKILLEVGGLNADLQHEKLAAVFGDWKGSLEQVDDVCIIGVRID